MKTTSIVFINVLRYLTLSLSLIGFACHFAQCALLSEYQLRTDIPSWFNAGHWQYLAWYVMFAFSILSALAVCTHATCCKRAHILRGDKCLGVVNAIPLAAVILTNTFLANEEPWTNGIVEFKVPAKGFITYCGLLNQENDASYPLLLQSTYVTAITLWLSWSLLLLCACCFKPKKISSVARLPNETGWKIPSNSNNKRKSSNQTTMADTTYDSHHPDARKYSSSLEANYYPFQYNATPPPAAAANNGYNTKYPTQIAPQMEKLQLPEDYHHRHSGLLMTQNQNNIPLSRHYPATPQGAWTANDHNISPPGTSLYYYDSHENSAWYPRFS